MRFFFPLGLKMRRVKDDPNISAQQWTREIRFVLVSTIILLLFFMGWTLRYSLLDALIVMGLGFFILVPAFITNGMMVVMGKIKGIPRYPLDGGKLWKDGKRILGEGKSWNGFIGGWLVGFLLSAIISRFIFNAISSAENYSAYGLVFITPAYISKFIVSAMNPTSYWLSQCFIALGSPLGDALGSFFKRRRGVGRGESFLFWDQNDFIIVALLIALIWYQMYWYFWVFLILFGPLITFVANWIGYLMYKKDVPW